MTRFFSNALLLSRCGSEDRGCGRGHLVQRLKEQGLDVDAAIKVGRYIPLDADDTLSTFMVNDTPDSDRFFEVVGGLIEAVSKREKIQHPRVAVFGEWVSLL
jgi:hypothetical protein